MKYFFKCKKDLDFILLKTIKKDEPIHVINISHDGKMVLITDKNENLYKWMDIEDFHEYITRFE